MSEYIKKEDAIEYLNDLFGEMCHVSFGDVLQSINSLQTYSFSDSAENKGDWIKIKSGDKDFPESIVCSKCKNENSHLDFNEHAEPIGKVFVTSKFCPNCGADMREEK